MYCVNVLVIKVIFALHTIFFIKLTFCLQQSFIQIQCLNMSILFLNSNISDAYGYTNYQRKDILSMFYILAI